MSFENPTVEMVRKIIIASITNELGEISDKYGIPVEVIESMAISLYIKDTSKTQWKSTNTKFFKVFQKELDMLYDNKIINFQEFGFMAFLNRFTGYEDNTLRNEDGSFCTQKDIVNATGMSKPTISRMLKGLIEKKLIFERKHDSVINGKRYMLSPYLFYKGKMIDNKLKEKLKELNQTFIDTWSNNNPDSEIDDEINVDVENLLSQIEKEIVNQHDISDYLNVVG